MALFIVINGADISSYLFLLVLLRSAFTRDLNGLFQDIQNNRLLTSFMLLLVVSVVSFLLLGGSNGQEIVVSYVRIFLVLVCFVAVFRSIGDLRYFAPYLFLACVLVDLHLYTQSIGANPLVSREVFNEWGRLEPGGLTGQKVNSNSFAITLTWGLCLLFYYVKYFTKNQTQVWSFVACGALLLASLPVLGLLGARASILIVLLSVSITLLGLTFKRVAVTAIFLVVAAFGLFQSELSNQQWEIPLVGEVANQRFNELPGEVGGDEYKYARGNLAKAAINEIILENPIIGVGTGSSADYMEKTKLIGAKKSIHNTYLTIVADLGITGIFLIVLFIRIWDFKGLGKPFQVLRLNLFLIVLLYGMVHNFELMSMSWLVLAFCFQYCYLYRRQLETRDLEYNESQQNNSAPQLLSKVG